MVPVKVSKITIHNDTNAYIIKDDSNKLLGYFDKEAIDLLSELKKDNNILQAVNNILKSRNSLTEDEKTMYIDSTLEVCLQLENMGIIRKI